MSDNKCAVCFIYPAQHGKVVCVKCDSMNFVPGDKKGNTEKSQNHMEWVYEAIEKMFPDEENECDFCGGKGYIGGKYINGHFGCVLECRHCKDSD